MEATMLIFHLKNPNFALHINHWKKQEAMERDIFFTTIKRINNDFFVKTKAHCINIFCMVFFLCVLFSRIWFLRISCYVHSLQKNHGNNKIIYKWRQHENAPDNFLRRVSVQFCDHLLFVKYLSHGICIFCEIHYEETDNYLFKFDSQIFQQIVLLSPHRNMQVAADEKELFYSIV